MQEPKNPSPRKPGQKPEPEEETSPSGAAEEQGSHVSIGDVDGGIHDLQIAGRDINIFTRVIQTLPRWLLILAAIVLPILIVLGVINAPPIAARLFPEPCRLDGDFNIALAQFQVTGQGEGMAGAKQLAQNLDNALAQEIGIMEGELGQAFRICPPGKTGTIRGPDEEISQEAQQRAEDLGAQVLVYGTIEVDGLAVTVHPIFLVGLTEFDPGEEITGEYRLGEVVRIDNVNNLSRRKQISQEIGGRFHALTYVIYGLSDYDVGEYAAAREKFQQALDAHTWDNPDVLYVLLGNVALKEHRLQDAELAYRNAIEANPRYSRAIAGLGNILYQQALAGVGTDYRAADAEKLDKAIETLNSALAPETEKPRLSDIDTRVQLVLGQAYLLKALADRANENQVASQSNLKQAASSLQTVLDAYGEGQNPHLAELAGVAHGTRGLMYRLTGDTISAVNEYEKALQLTPPLDRTQADRERYRQALADLKAIPSVAQAAGLRDVSYDFSSHLSDLDLNALKPADVIAELSYSVSLSGYSALNCLGIGPFTLFEPANLPGYISPVLVADTTQLHERILEPDNSPYTPKICTCGYEENQPIDISLIDPSGKVLFQKRVAAEPAMTTNGFPLDYCYSSEEISRFDFLPGDPLGDYIVRLSSTGAQLVHHFTLQAQNTPSIYYSERLKAFVLAGFTPREELRILVFDGNLEFQAEGRLTLDQNGVGLLELGDPQAVIFAYRGNEVVARRLNERLSQIGYNLVLFTPLVPEDLTGLPKNELDDIIKEKPNYQPAYLARANIYLLNDQVDLALADFRKAVELKPESAQAWMGLASLQYEARNLEKAREAYQKVVELNPKEPKAYYFLARILLDLGHLEEARQAYQLLIETFPDPDSFYYADPKEDRRSETSHSAREEYINLLIELGRYPDAIQEANRLIERTFIDNSRFYYLRGRAYEQSGQISQALADFEKVIESAYVYSSELDYGLTVEDYDRVIENSPRFAKAYLGRGLLHMKNGSSEEALQDFDSAIGLDDQLAYAVQKHAEAATALGKYDLAIQDYTNLIAVETDYPGYTASMYLARAEVYHKQGKLELAAADYRKAYDGDEHPFLRFDEKVIPTITRAIELDPSFPRFYLIRGSDYLEVSRFDPAYKDYTEADILDLAVKDFNQAIQLDPKYAEAYVRRGDLYTDQGKTDLALADYWRAVELGFDQYDLDHEIRNLLDPYSEAIRTGDFSGLPLDRQALEGLPFIAKAYSLLGETDYKYGDYGAALENFAFALMFDPQDASVYLSRGDAYARLGQLQPAVADYTKALELDSKLTLAFARRGVAYNRLGDYTQALQDFSTAIQADPKQPSYYYERGLAYKHLENKEKAKEDFLTFLSFNPPENWQMRAEARLNEP